MFPKKPGKKELPDKGPYTYHPIQEHAGKTRNWNQGYYRVVSIDPAEIDLAFRIEKRDYDGVNVKTEVFVKWDMSMYSTAYTNTDTSYIYSHLMGELDKYTDLFKETHLVLIERQMAINFRMVRFSMCLISYFLRKMRKGIYLPMIYEIDSQLKSKQLGAPKGFRGVQLKEWGIEVSLHILEYRRDTISYNIIKNEKSVGKKDDLADTVIQIEAFFKYMGLETTFEHLNIRATVSYSLTIQPKNDINRPQPQYSSLNSQHLPQHLPQLRNQYTLSQSLSQYTLPQSTLQDLSRFMTRTIISNDFKIPDTSKKF